MRDFLTKFRQVESNDVTLGITQWQLGGQAPNRFLGHIPLLFKMVEQRPARPQHFRVLFGRNPPKIPGAKLAGAPTDDLGLMAQAVAFDQRFIHRQVATGRILDKESHVGRMVEKLGQHLRFHRQDACKRLGGKSPDCAQFHAGRGKYTKTPPAAIA